MSEANNVDPGQVTTVTSTCSSGCHLGRMRPLVRAVLYAPLILLAGSYVAVGMFPGLAEYATPLIGDGHSTNGHCPLSRCSAGRHETNYEEDEFGVASSCHAFAGCCPSSCPASEESDVADALTALSTSPSDEVVIPRDAISAVIGNESESATSQ